MVTGAEIAGGFASLKAVKDLLKGAYEAKVEADVRAKVYEAMDKLGDAQDTLQELRASNYELLEANQSLKQQLAEAKGWADKAAAYMLATAPGGAIAYRFTAEPPHWACPSCFNKQQVQPLQTNRTLSGKYRCVGCEAEFPIEVQKQAPPQSPMDYGLA